METIYTTFQKLKHLISPRKAFVVLTILVSFSTISILSAQQIQIVVVDQETKETLPYTSMRWLQKGSGSVSDAEGNHLFDLSTISNTDSLEFNYIGYETLTLPYTKLLAYHNKQVALQPILGQLDEVIVTPKTAADVVAYAIERIPFNYPNQSYGVTGYYEDYFAENGTPLEGNKVLYQGIFPSWNAQDNKEDSASKIRILQGKTVDPGEIQFLRKRVEKKKKKTGKDEEAIVIDLGDVFGNPSNALSADPIRGEELFFQEGKFKKYKFEYAPDIRMGDLELYVINFRTKGKVEHERNSGTVYIDKASHAFIQFDYEGVFVVPLYVKPLLAMFGVGIKNPIYQKHIRYRENDGIWVSELLRTEVDVQTSEKHFFRKNDDFQFFVKQMAVSAEVHLDTTQINPKGVIFDKEKPLREQLPDHDETIWSEYAHIVP
jgi:hypothetical protein